MKRDIGMNLRSTNKEHDFRNIIANGKSLEREFFV